MNTINKYKWVIIGILSGIFLASIGVDGLTTKGFISLVSLIGMFTVSNCK